MKHFKRLNMYKASNVTFNPETLEAHSYSHWCFFKVINGKNVFNNYNYSNSTCKHQSKVRSLLRELNISIDLEIECPKGLQADYNGELSVSKHYSDKITVLKEAIAKPRSQAKKNIERQKEIDLLAAKCVEFKLLCEG